LPYILPALEKKYKTAVSDVKSLKKQLATMQSTTIARGTYERIKNNLVETDKELKSAKTKVKHYTTMYFGMKEKYSNQTERIENMQAGVKGLLAKINAYEAKMSKLEEDYQRALTQSATSRTSMTKMKLNYQRQTQTLLKRLREAEKEAESARQESKDLMTKIQEIEANERHARENSLTQAMVNTRDTLFDATFNGVGVNESGSRALAVAMGAVVAAFLMTRVD
jgi:chromosome segregation ATPase